MSKRAAEYTVSCFVILGKEGKMLPFDELSVEKTEKMRCVLSERLSRAVSEYCRSNPKAFETIPEIDAILQD